MITRTFLDKSTTIIKDTTNNYGLHPISMLNHGGLLSRIMIHFDLEKIKGLIDDKTYYDTSKLKHVLKMKNCGSINPEKHKEKLTSADTNGVKERATSFSVIAFKVPKYWDEGVGFDNANDFWLVGKSATSKDGCTWYNATNEETWDDEGIYSTDILFEEYKLYQQGKESVIITEQHFDHGNENLELDLTSYVNDVIFNEVENHGICIAFIPTLENTSTKLTQYVGFFNNKTNTIFNPVLESRYDCDITDDRMSFALDKENKIYLYAFINGALENLDEIPNCELEHSTCPSGGAEIKPIVQQESKGIYSATLKLPSKYYKANSIVYDTWSNLSYNGDKIDDVELEFATHPREIYFNIGSKVIEPKVLNPMLVGIDDNEKVNIGEERMLKVFFRIPYTNRDFKLCDNSWYRIYAKDGDREITIVDWDKLLKMDTHNFFMIKTNEYVPTEYHVDIKAKFGDETRIFKNQLTFKIVSNPTEQDM